jgi:RNA polymerase sigma-70 factor (ECF subfamily)
MLVSAAQQGAVEDRARRRLGMNRVAVSDGDLERVEALATAEAVTPALHQGLKELPRAQREAVLARVLAEDEYADIAARARTTELVIRKRVQRGLAGLRQRLEGEGA